MKSSESVKLIQLTSKTAMTPPDTDNGTAAQRLLIQKPLLSGRKRVLTWRKLINVPSLPPEVTATWRNFEVFKPETNRPVVKQN